MGAGSRQAQARHLTTDDLRVMGGYGIGRILPFAKRTKSSGRTNPGSSNNSAFSVSPITVAQHALVEFASQQAGKFGFEIDRTRALLARQVCGSFGNRNLDLGLCRDRPIEEIFSNGFGPVA